MGVNKPCTTDIRGQRRALLVTACIAGLLVTTCAPPSEDITTRSESQSAVEPKAEQEQVHTLLWSDDQDIASLRDDIPFITMYIGEYRVHSKFAPLTDGYLYLTHGGDSDGWHSYITLLPDDLGERGWKQTADDMRSWKTEHGFGYGSSLDELVSLIGAPTRKVTIDDLHHYSMTSVLATPSADADSSREMTSDGYRAYVYQWKYKAEFDEETYPAVYTLTVVHKEKKVIGLIIDVAEAL